MTRFSHFDQNVESFPNSKATGPFWKITALGQGEYIFRTPAPPGFLGWSKSCHKMTNFQWSSLQPHICKKNKMHSDVEQGDLYPNCKLDPSRESFTIWRWRCQHCRWRTAKFRTMLGAYGLWARRDLDRAIPVATRGLVFFNLIWRTALLVASSDKQGVPRTYWIYFKPGSPRYLYLNLQVFSSHGALMNISRYVWTQV